MTGSVCCYNGAHGVMFCTTVLCEVAMLVMLLRVGECIWFKKTSKKFMEIILQLYMFFFPQETLNFRASNF